jgi:hypothetical protein
VLTSIDDDGAALALATVDALALATDDDFGESP